MIATIEKQKEFEERMISAIHDLNPIARESLKFLMNEYIQNQRDFTWNLTDLDYLKQRKRIEQFFEDNCGIKLTLAGSFFYARKGLLMPCTQLITKL